MYVHAEGNLVHFYTADPDRSLAAASRGAYVGSVTLMPREKPDSDELAARLGVISTPFEYDFAADTGAKGTYLISRKIPSGARIVDGFYAVETTFTSAGTDGATLDLGINAAADLKAAETIAAATAWDTATPVRLPAALIDSVLLTADRQVAFKITTQVVTAGKLRGIVRWTFDDAYTATLTAE